MKKKTTLLGTYLKVLVEESGGTTMQVYIIKKNGFFTISFYREYKSLEFGVIIQFLFQFGYTNTNLSSCIISWRTPGGFDYIM